MKVLVRFLVLCFICFSSTIYAEIVYAPGEQLNNRIEFCTSLKDIAKQKGERDRKAHIYDHKVYLGENPCPEFKCGKGFNKYDPWGECYWRYYNEAFYGR